MSGHFIVFEGGDGAGKSTQVQILVEALTTAGHEVVRTREPGGTPLGDQLRSLVLDAAARDMDARTEALLMAADKAQHLAEVVRPALDRGAVVVCDRYADSMIAYQGAGRQMGVDEVSELVQWATAGVRPDLTVLLDVDPQVAVQQKMIKDRLEGMGSEFHDRVRQAFLRLAEADHDHYLVIPARRTRAEIAGQVWERVNALVSVPDGRLDP